MNSDFYTATQPIGWGEEHNQTDDVMTAIRQVEVEYKKKIKAGIILGEVINTLKMNKDRGVLDMVDKKATKDFYGLIDNWYEKYKEVES